MTRDLATLVDRAAFGDSLPSRDTIRRARRQHQAMVEVLTQAGLMPAVHAKAAAFEAAALLRDVELAGRAPVLHPAELAAR